MNTQKEIKLSSNSANVGLYGRSLIILVMVPIMIIITKEQ